MAKKKKTSKKKSSPVFGEGVNAFKGEVIKTDDYNKEHGLIGDHEEPALRSAAEVLVPVKEHRLNEPDITRCSKCGHKCHCESKKPCGYRTWSGAIGGPPGDVQECKCKKCYHAEVVKDFPKKKKKRIAKASLIDLLDRKRFGKGTVKDETV